MEPSLLIARVVMIGDGWQGQWAPHGGSLSGDPGLPDFDDVMDWGARLSRGKDVPLPEGVRALVNGPWF